MKGVTKNRKGEETKVIGWFRDGKSDTDPRAANGMKMWDPVVLDT